MQSALLVNDVRKDDILTLQSNFEKKGYICTVAGSLDEARHALKRSYPDLALINPLLPDGNGLLLLDNKQFCDVTEIFLLLFDEQGAPNISRVQTGYPAPSRKEDFTSSLLGVTADVTEAVSKESLVDNVLYELQNGFCRMRGNSQLMQRLYGTIKKVAPTQAIIFLVGESGAGKELVADAIHQLSDRSDKPLVTMNCGAVSSEIMESELFGHEKGAFTGATKSHAGYFERANGGTLFLDEITEMPLELQVKLLRILETGKFHRVGGESEIEVDVRVISATNRDPLVAVEKKLLREDLYFRLAQFPIEVPPLRRHMEDVPALAQHFLGQANRKYGKNKMFSADALAGLRRHSWPGNVRELKNAVERAYIVANVVIESRHFQIEPVQPSPDTVPRGSAGEVRLRVGTSLCDAEKAIIAATLADASYNKTIAAQTLGISLKTLYNKLKKYKLSDRHSA